MNNTYLIEKYGEPITVDAIGVEAYFEDIKKSHYFKRSAIYTSFDAEVIHTVSEVALNAVLVARGDNFGVLESKPVRTNGEVSYSETWIYKDDFINDVTIEKQSLKQSGVNLPNAVAGVPIVTKARIKTVKPTEYLQIALHGAKVPTHLFVIKYVDGITTGDSIEWGARTFEVLAIENINETNTLLIFDCIEVV